MLGTYIHWLVGLSVAVAVMVSYTALSLASRLAAANSSLSRVWLIGGSITMGIGIWSMHFIGMMAFTLPIALRYDVGRTLGSLLIAMLTSGFALRIAQRRKIWTCWRTSTLRCRAGSAAIHRACARCC